MRISLSLVLFTLTGSASYTIFFKPWLHNPVFHLYASKPQTPPPPPPVPYNLRTRAVKTDSIIDGPSNDTHLQMTRNQRSKGANKGGIRTNKLSFNSEEANGVGQQSLRKNNDKTRASAGKRNRRPGAQAYNLWRNRKIAQASPSNVGRAAASKMAGNSRRAFQTGNGVKRAAARDGEGGSAGIPINIWMKQPIQIDSQELQDISNGTGTSDFATKGSRRKGSPVNGTGRQKHRRRKPHSNKRHRQDSSETNGNPYDRRSKATGARRRAWTTSSPLHENHSNDTSQEISPPANESSADIFSQDYDGEILTIDRSGGRQRGALKHNKPLVVGVPIYIPYRTTYGIPPPQPNIPYNLRTRAFIRDPDHSGEIFINSTGAQRHNKSKDYRHGASFLISSSPLSENLSIERVLQSSTNGRPTHGSRPTNKLNKVGAFRTIYTTSDPVEQPTPIQHDNDTSQEILPVANDNYTDNASQDNDGEILAIHLSGGKRHGIEKLSEPSIRGLPIYIPYYNRFRIPPPPPNIPYNLRTRAFTRNPDHSGEIIANATEVESSIHRKGSKNKPRKQARATPRPFPENYANDTSQEISPPANENSTDIDTYDLTTFEDEFSEIEVIRKPSQQSPLWLYL